MRDAPAVGRVCVSVLVLCTYGVGRAEHEAQDVGPQMAVPFSPKDRGHATTTGGGGCEVGVYLELWKLQGSSSSSNRPLPVHTNYISAHNADENSRTFRQAIASCLHGSLFAYLPFNQLRGVQLKGCGLDPPSVLSAPRAPLAQHQ
jgi:hypothetical protein